MRVNSQLCCYKIEKKAQIKPWINDFCVLLTHDLTQIVIQIRIHLTFEKTNGLIPNNLFSNLINNYS